MSRARNSGTAGSCTAAAWRSSGADLDRVLGELLGDALEERHRLAREQRDLLLLDEHGERARRDFAAWMRNVR